MTLRTKWWLLGIGGAILLGLGLSLIAEASYWKHDGSAWYWWVFGGSLGLSSSVSGVVFLVDTGIIKYKLDQKARNESPPKHS